MPTRRRSNHVMFERCTHSVLYDLLLPVYGVVRVCVLYRRGRVRSVSGVVAEVADEQAADLLVHRRWALVGLGERLLVVRVVRMMGVVMLRRRVDRGGEQARAEDERARWQTRKTGAEGARGTV